MTKKPWYRDKKKLLDIVRAASQEDREEEIEAGIIRNEQGRFITVYMPNVSGSFERALSDLETARENCLISPELYGAVSKYIKARKLACESWADRAFPLTIEQAKRVFRSIMRKD